MIVGIGLDMIELERIENLVTRKQKFVDRVLTKNERKEFSSYEGRRSIEFIAGRFAAKEAYAKAKGTGIGSQLSFQDIEIRKDTNGKPSIMEVPQSADFFAHVSITHTEKMAAAQVIIERLK
ncbi:holo-ACP synthase [Bacillus spongiae]|uniref:Holo-[acyl-carrier-protein] synthase n=1 Tax=Bacillus spongiae TaxID=2683610 RepID=A0ABU8HJU8_9BACI